MTLTKGDWQLDPTERPEMVTNHLIDGHHFFVRAYESSSDEFSVVLIEAEAIEVLHYYHTFEGMGLQRHSDNPALICAAALALLQRLNQLWSETEEEKYR